MDYIKRMRGVFIVSAVRTPIGKFGGALANLTAVDLGVVAVREALQRAGVTSDAVAEVFIGQARQAGNGPNPARQISYRAGIPESVPACTINKACGSGLKAIMLAYNEITLGNADVVVAGGVESMSRVPYLLEDARWGKRLGHRQLTDGMYRDGFFCPLSELMMGETAEKLAKLYGISRAEQDEYALESQLRANAAVKAGRFLDETVSLPELDHDEHVRSDASLAGMQKLSPVFSGDGSVTAGNSSGITDGGAALVLASEEAVRERQLKPIGRIVESASAGVDPSIMGIAPVPAVKKLIAKTGLSLDQFGLIELNEAFAAQVLACLKELAVKRDRLNVNGGAIALGHPIGCTGARIVTTLVHEMAKRNVQYGLATLCISGGLGLAMAVERP